MIHGLQLAPARRATLRLVLAVAWLVTFVSTAHAQLGRHVIEAGREAEVVALFAPHALGAPITQTWRLAGVSVQRDHILATVEGPEGSRAGLRLDHLDAARGDVRTRSFALTREGDDPQADPALRALEDAVRRNDVRPFWHQREQLDVPEPLERGAPRRAADGILIALAGLALLITMVVHQLRSAPRWVGPALIGIVLGGGAIRLALSPVTALGVWPYSRILRLAAMIFEGPVLEWLGSAAGARIEYTELVFTLNLVVATLTPLAAYAHAHYVLRDPRAALACAALFAIFPNHIRFSHSEVEFVLSLALSSFALALLHAALVERARALQLLSVLALPVVLYGAIVTRELNVLLVPLCVAAAVALRGDAPRGRLVAVLVGVALGGALGIAYVLELYPMQVREGTSLGTLLNSVEALFSLRYNTLINPWVTPPGITVLAGLGAWWLWRAGERRHLMFLVGWLAFYFAAHSYVLPSQVEMQARYHLHLATPLLLLAAPAIVRLWDEKRRIAWAVLAYLAASPLIHVGFIRDTAFNDMREYSFLRESRPLLPDGCTILEYQGLYDHDVRMARMGLVLESSARTVRWTVVPAGAEHEGGSDPLRPEVRALLADPPECLVYYEGIQCWAVKDVSEPIAPACAALRDLAPLEELAHTTFESRVYDENLARGFGPDLDRLTLTLYRVRPRPSRAPSTP